MQLKGNFQRGLLSQELRDCNYNTCSAQNLYAAFFSHKEKHCTSLQLCTNAAVEKQAEQGSGSACCLFMKSGQLSSTEQPPWHDSDLLKCVHHSVLGSFNKAHMRTFHVLCEASMALVLGTPHLWV